jgi:hypothetical protein
MSRILEPGLEPAQQQDIISAVDCLLLVEELAIYVDNGRGWSTVSRLLQ